MWFFRAVSSRQNTRLMQCRLRSTAISLSFIVLTILLTGCDGGSRSSLPPVTPLPVTSGTQLLFDTAAVNGNVFTPGIDTIAPDGSNLQRVINDSSGAEPRFSADGSKIVYVAGSGISFIAIANADGSNAAATGQGNFPAFRSDGKALVFVGSNWGLYTSNVDGSQLRQIIANTVGSLSHPIYTPDGTKIAFLKLLDSSAYINGTPTYEIHIVNVDGTGEARVGTKLAVGTSTLDWH